MPRYLLLSIPMIAAAILGLAGYFITLAVSDYPSQEEIDAAPVYDPAAEREDRSGQSIVDKIEKKYSEHSDDEDTVIIGTDDDNEKTGLWVDAQRGEYRQNLEITRRNAFRRARRIGAIAALVTALSGYALLALHFTRLSRKKPKTSWRDAVGATPENVPPLPLVTHGETKTYEDDVPAEEVIEEAPFEPYDAPVDISELERAHQEAEQKKPEE